MRGARPRPFAAWPLRAVHVDHGLQAAAAALSRGLRGAVRASLRSRSTRRRRRGRDRGRASRSRRRRATRAMPRSRRELQPGECLLTAHHAQDQAETLLLQALRGAGLKGLSAMPVCRRFGRGWHLRPLLDVTQQRACARSARAPCASTRPTIR